jgi:hypothetical protein
MKALTICQPWAWAIVHGPKRIENRTWPTAYRGPLLIHAGMNRTWYTPILNDGSNVPPANALVYGALIGMATLVDCCRPDKLKEPWHSSPFAEGPICWALAEIRPFAHPLPMKGAQGLWNVPGDLDDLVRELMPDAPRVACDGCGWKGRVSEMDPGEDGADETIRCPRCGSPGWTFD